MYFDKYKVMEYRAMCLADADLAKYRYIMENYSVFELTELYYFTVVRAIVNG